MRAPSLILVLVAALGIMGATKTDLLGLYPVDMPAGNAITVERTKLGEKLFFERRLSKSGKLSCASCHQPDHAYSDPRVFSLADGVPRHRRNAQSILNVGHRRSLGWDGDARSLEKQAELTFGPYGDMGISLGEALEKIEADPGYRAGCRAAYRTDIDADCLLRALATFERSLISSGSRFDQFLFGRRASALSPLEQEGWKIFSGRGACIDCHDVFHPDVNPLGGAYATFSDERFHNLGVGYRNGIMADTGRYDATRDPANLGAFKTPLLRNVSQTAPYMHDGSLATLEEVVDFYNRGGTENPNQSSGIKPLFLTEHEKAATVAFLHSLDSAYYVPKARTSARFSVLDMMRGRGERR